MSTSTSVSLNQANSIPQMLGRAPPMLLKTQGDLAAKGLAGRECDEPVVSTVVAM